MLGRAYLQRTRRSIRISVSSSIDRQQQILSSNSSFSYYSTTSSTMDKVVTKQKHLTLNEVERICQRALSASGLNDIATAAVTDAVTTAERDGCKSHGLFRISGYCEALLNGTVDGTIHPKVKDAAPSVVRVDAGKLSIHVMVSKTMITIIMRRLSLSNTRNLSHNILYYTILYYTILSFKKRWWFCPSSHSCWSQFGDLKSSYKWDFMFIDS